MLDSKYAKLPGIDQHGVDIYETSYLPEDDQHVVSPVQETRSNSVQTVNITTNEAFNKFKEKEIEAEVLRRSASNNLSFPEYHAFPERHESETVVQMYQRLLAEVNVLNDEMSKNQSLLEGSQAEQLTEAVASLQRQLQSLETATDNCSSSASDQAAFSKLLMNLDNFKSIKETSESAKAASSEAVDSRAVYELYFNPEKAKFHQNKRLSELDHRLDMLESRVGDSPEKLSVLTMDLQDKTLFEAAKELHSKITLLDPKALDTVESRLSALSHKLTKAMERVDGNEEVERTSKVDELYDLVKKWDAYVVSLPQVVERLVSLNSLHQEASTFSTRLRQLDEIQADISLRLDSQDSLLKDTSKSFSSNLEIIKQNMETINKRIDTLTNLKKT